LVSAKTYKDVYGSSVYWAAGLGYDDTSLGEVRVEASYTSKASENLQVGTVANLPLFARFGDYKAWGVDVGCRQYLGSGAAPSGRLQAHRCI
jgi:hypothetical protein